MYHPPKADDFEMLNYLIESISFIEANYFGCCVIILGDFNRLNISRLITNFKLKQIINFSTSGQNMLDLVLTIKLPAFGLSDYVTIVVKPKAKMQDKPVTAPFVITRPRKICRQCETCVLAAVNQNYDNYRIESDRRLVPYTSKNTEKTVDHRSDSIR